MRLFIYIFALSILFIACSNDNKKELTVEQLQTIKKQSIEINKKISQTISDSIDTYISEKNLEMTKTGTGLRYKITPSGLQDSIKTGDIIEISYSVSLLNGKDCYSSDSLGNKALKVGQGGVESGVEEAFLLMCKGDKAHLIIPPHLAHGLQGDLQKIPPYAILNYKIEITKHKPKQ